MARNGPRHAYKNGFVEGCNGRLRGELLDKHLFAKLRDAHLLIAAWRDDCNTPTRAATASHLGSNSNGQFRT